jgi:hypothetical protein
LCDFLNCLVESGALNDRLVRRLEEYGIDVSAFLRCLKRVCHETKDGPRIG